MRKNGVEVLINLLFWMVTGWLITHGFSIEVQDVTVENGIETVNIVRNHDIQVKLLVVVFISAFFFYINLKNVSNLPQQKKRLWIIFLSVLILFLPILLYYLIESLWMTIPARLPRTIILGIFLFYFTSSIAYGIARVWQRAERQRQQLALEKKQAELTLLRSQLHPHFLFNVLNNLLALVDQKRNPTLAQSLDRLSGLLRYVVYDTTEPSVPIRKEIDFIRNYAALQMQRFEKEEIDFKLEIVGEYDLQRIEPGIFIPFVENAFKYGVEPEKKSELSILFDLSAPDRIVFVSTNPIYPVLQNIKGNGSGIASAKSRLNLVYPNKHKLMITENEYYKVHIELQTDASDHS